MQKAAPPLIRLADYKPSPYLIDTVALEFALFAVYAGQGEVCSAGSRLLLDRKLAGSFL